MSSTREEILKTTCRLLDMQGYHGTGLNQIIKESGTPKGSLYYHFPEGKEGLAAEAVQRAGSAVEERIRESMAQVEDPAQAVKSFILTLAHFVRASDFQTGGPITTVALEAATTSERLNTACRDVYANWQAAFEEKLHSSGFDAERAERLATLILAALEGAIILSRTRRTTTPLEYAAEELACLIRTSR